MDHDFMPNANKLREDWLRTHDLDNFHHVTATLNASRDAQATGGTIPVTITFEGGTGKVPKVQWILTLETHLREIGFGIESRKTTTSGGEEIKVFF